MVRVTYSVKGENNIVENVACADWVLYIDRGCHCKIGETMMKNCCYHMEYFRCWKEVRNIVSFQYVAQSASAIDISNPKRPFSSNIRMR